MIDGWTIVPGVGDRPTVAISPSRNMSVSIDGGKLHVLFDDSVAATNAVAVPASVLAALSAPPPDLTIEQLIDALVDKTWWCAHASSFDIDAATSECKAARSALLAAISRRVPGDLAGLLRRFVAARNEDPTAWRAVATEITEWTRANLPAKEKTDAAE